MHVLLGEGGAPMGYLGGVQLTDWGPSHFIRDVRVVNKLSKGSDNFRVSVHCRPVNGGPLVLVGQVVGVGGAAVVLTPHGRQGDDHVCVALHGSNLDGGFAKIVLGVWIVSVVR